MIPLIERFPPLAAIPRASLVRAPTPVARLSALGDALWIKRDDLSGEPIGGNKVRALEFLLGGLARGAPVVTVGSAGSTHALSVATFGQELGLEVFVGRWRQEMNASAARVGERTARIARSAPVFRTVAQAYAWAFARRARGARWIAAGGSTPLGILGHVNAGLELVAQIDAGLLPQPARVVLPLGTGGTAAGLALAFAIAGRPIEIVAVQVVPLILANVYHVRRLAWSTARYIKRRGGAVVPSLPADAIRVVRTEYGGAYGRETGAARAAAERLRGTAGIALDATYSAKAFAHALAIADGSSRPTLFWLTFDPRTLEGTAHD